MVLDAPPRLHLASVIAANVRAEVARAGYSQTTLARLLGVSSPTASFKWRGLRDWSFDDLQTIAFHCRIPVSVLLDTSDARLEGLEPPTF